MRRKVFLENGSQQLPATLAPSDAAEKLSKRRASSLDSARRARLNDAPRRDALLRGRETRV
jgi:hypothetical protein